MPQLIIPRRLAFLGLHTKSQATGGAFTYSALCPQRKFLQIASMLFITPFGSMNKDDQYVCIENITEWMSCSRPAYDKDLDVQHGIRFVIFSITVSQSALVHLLGDSGIPKCLIRKGPIPNPVKCTSSLRTYSWVPAINICDLLLFACSLVALMKCCKPSNRILTVGVWTLQKIMRSYAKHELRSFNSLHNGWNFTGLCVPVCRRVLVKYSSVQVFLSLLERNHDYSHSCSR